MYIIVGLGNPGDKYTDTRHNAGRLAAEYISKSRNLAAKFIVPDNFMNKSGNSIVKVIKNKKAAEKLIVIHDDLDLPLGVTKISYNRGSGGHRGVESIIRMLKTEAFIRVRIGISPTIASGKMKKPKGEKEVEKFILSDFKPQEIKKLKEIFKKVSAAIFKITEEGLAPAMTEFN